MRAIQFSEESIETSRFTGKYNKPAICPYCNIGTDAPIRYKEHFSIGGDKYILVYIYTCTSCKKEFFYACCIDESKDDVASIVCIYPNTGNAYKNDLLEKISPRFLRMYNQALRSEQNEDFELAAIGYRSALEFLIKDYAIIELNEDKKIVSKKSLFQVISDYLKQDELLKTSDVVRILGNDFTHYQRKYPEHDFNIIKTYMSLSIAQIETHYTINHPPVSRE